MILCPSWSLSMSIVGKVGVLSEGFVILLKPITEMSSGRAF
jgi:hypothetical protein